MVSHEQYEGCRETGSARRRIFPVPEEFRPRSTRCARLRIPFLTVRNAALRESSEAVYRPKKPRSPSAARLPTSSLARPRAIAFKLRHLVETGRQTAEQLRMKAIARFSERVVAPRPALPNCDQTGTAQVCKVPRRRRLGHFQRSHQVADAHLAVLQEVEDPQPRSVRERPKQPIDRDTCLLKHEADFSVRRHTSSMQSRRRPTVHQRVWRRVPSWHLGRSSHRYAGCTNRGHRHRMRHSLRRISRASRDSLPDPRLARDGPGPTCAQVIDPPAGGAGDRLGPRRSGLCCRL